MGRGTTVLDMSEQQSGVVEDHSHDRVFVVTFLGVLAVLVGIAIVIGIIANNLDGDPGMSPEARAQVAERVAPLGEVYTDASQVPAAPAPAANSERSTSDIVASVCGACHDSGLLNAPKTGDAAVWKQRMAAAGGLDGLVAAAINGKGSMPPRGGDASLTDAQVRAAVEAMLGN